MEIIRQGNPRTECVRCHCVMAYNSSDIQRKDVEVNITRFLRMSELWRVEYVICPQCGKEITINQKCLR